MGRLGRTPILQVGGVQEAKTVAPPRLARAVALLIPVVVVLLLKAATSGLVVLQVRGGLVSLFFAHDDAPKSGPSNRISGQPLRLRQSRRTSSRRWKNSTRRESPSSDRKS